MKKECKKYEGLFTFASEEDFLSHVESCPDCKAEYEKMAKISDLIQEAAPLIKKERKNKARLKLACASVALVFCTLTMGAINFIPDVHDAIYYGQTLSVEDYGFPVDSYGLIMVDD